MLVRRKRRIWLAHSRHERVGGVQPGVPKDQLELRVDRDALVIEEVMVPFTPAKLGTVYAEVQLPRYRRNSTLSRELDASRIEANLKDAVLTLRIPKRAHAQPASHLGSGVRLMMSWSNRTRTYIVATRKSLPLDRRRLLSPTTSRRFGGSYRVLANPISPCSERTTWRPIEASRHLSSLKRPSKASTA
ncbi:MAG: Hsp20/alpha crystallin family protein [Burkholderiales bacterium]|nr:Hsp20/alpha crystallin family protein [Burkholderiales bacterium]